MFRLAPLTRQLGARLVMQRAAMAAPVMIARQFSLSTRRMGEADPSLVEKLTEEIQYEKEAAALDNNKLPEFIQAFKMSGIWSLEDTPTQDEVSISRTFGNEKIRLMFSVADLQNDEPSESEQQDEDEEGESSQSTPEADEEALQNYPIRVNCSISKGPGSGAMVLDMAVQEGAFLIENISYYKDEKLGLELTSEADWKRRGLYIGPQFDTLDLGVQEEFDRFILERGMDSDLALFIPEYAEYKEQSEYLEWLNGVKSFIEA